MPEMSPLRDRGRKIISFKPNLTFIVSPCIGGGGEIYWGFPCGCIEFVDHFGKKDSNNIESLNLYLDIYLPPPFFSFIGIL